MCLSESEQSPWLAIDYDSTVTVKRVEIHNRWVFGERTRDVYVRISNELPTPSSSQMFSGGSLLGYFAGPGSDGQLITIRGNIVQTFL